MNTKVRKLELKKETVRVLADSDLQKAAGGVWLTYNGCPTQYCLPFTQWFRTCECVAVAG
jgi:hypothetical protein